MITRLQVKNYRSLGPENGAILHFLRHLPLACSHPRSGSSLSQKVLSSERSVLSPLW